MRALVQPAPVYLHAVGMALFATVLPVFMTSGTIHHIGSSRTALICTIGPMLTIFLGAWLLGERLLLPQLAGAGLVLAGVLLLTRGDQPSHKRWQTPQ